MLALAFDLLTQIVFQLDRQTGLTTAEALGHPLQVVAAHCALGQLAKQGNKGPHRQLELVGTGSVSYTHPTLRTYLRVSVIGCG